LKQFILQAALISLRQAEFFKPSASFFDALLKDPLQVATRLFRLNTCMRIEGAAATDNFLSAHSAIDKI
jgi:hypothetical protein